MKDYLAKKDKVYLSKKNRELIKKMFYLIVTVINIFVAVSLLLSYLCVVVHPITVWWIGLFGLAYLHLLVVNLCFVVFWIFSDKKKMFVLSLAVILIGWPLLGRNIQLFGKKLPESEKQNWNLKVISFNVQAFTHRDALQPDGSWMNMFDFLHEKDADIICMQEFSVFSWSDELNEENVHKKFHKTPYRHIELTTFGPTGRHYKFGVATFSKYPIIRKKLIYTDSTTNACIYSDLLIGADTVRIFNIHLKSVGFQNDEKRFLYNMLKPGYGKSDVRAIKGIIRQLSLSSFERAKQVEIVNSHIEQSPYPVIICGDFNDPPTSYSYQRVRGNRKDAFVEAGSGLSTTFNIGRKASLRIDFIMYSDVFKAYDYESPRVRLSDHFPVMCTLVKRKK